MAYHPAIHFGDKGNREDLGGAQRGDDELLRVIADLQGLKRGDGRLSTRAPACPTNAVATRPLKQPRKGVRGVSWHGSGWWRCLSSSPGTNPSSLIQLFR